MMREIMFRGKRTDENIWVYGCLIDKIYGAVPVIVSNQSVDDAFDLDFEYDHVIEKTVGQYAGRKDKNGKRIFEGDILTGAWNTKIVIYFDESYLQFRAREVSPRKRENAIDYYDNCKLEIIGNIHDNPELLEV